MIVDRIQQNSAKYLPLKICCLIDSLHSGGAQRQMTWLVRSLVQNGHSVRLLTYHEFDHYLPLVRSLGVEPENVSSGTKVGRMFRVRSAIRRESPDAIISFLNTPNLLGIFSSLPPGKRIPLIVSERSLDVQGVDWSNRFRFNCFRFATKVVTNSYSQQQFVESNFPFLNPKLTTILNCVDLDKFKPRQIPRNSNAVSHSRDVRIIVAASVIAIKNAKSLIRAVARARDNGVAVSVDWYGNNLFLDGKPTAGSTYFLESQALVREMDLAGCFQFHAPVTNIQDKFGDYDACCLPSLQEGYPNVICESMSCGLPVLVSNLGDMQTMVTSERGFSFDPLNPESISQVLAEFSELSAEQKRIMGENNRAFAEESLSPTRFGQQYQTLLEEVVM